MRFPKVSTTNINGLPLGYTEVEYLEGSGTQYIDTGYIPNNKSEIEIICNSGGVQGTNLFGYRNASASSKNITITTSSTGTTVFYTIDFNNSNYNTYRYNFESNANQILKLKLSKSERSVYNTSGNLLGGNSVSCPDVFTCDSTAYLMNVAGTPFFTQCFKGKVYSCKISEAGVLVRDLIPCLDSNNRPCMYDKVESKPYYNLGTGEFSYGKKIYGVEYLESTGTQYINTGIKLNNNCSVKVDYQLTQAVQSRTGLFGALNMSGSNQGRIGSILSPSNQQLEHGYGAGNDYWQQGKPDINRHVIYQKKNETYFDGTLIHTFETATFSLAVDAYLGNFVFTNYTPAKAKYYSSQWWDGDTLIRDYIPVRDENNVGYMFDKVSHTLYENKGTGAFVVGKDTLGKSKAKLIRTKTTVSGLPYGYTEVEYIQSSGTQYIDTGISGSSTLKIEMNGQKVGASLGVYFGAGTGNSRIQAVYVNDYNSARIGNVTVAQIGPDTEKFNIVVDALNKNVIYNGTSYPFAYTSALTSLNIFIFTRNEGGSYADKATAKCWSFKIWDNDILVRDYVPCLDSNNRPCMYDKVESKPYYNLGTGEFSYGHKIIPIEYLGSTGTQYIDTGIGFNENTVTKCKFAFVDQTITAAKHLIGAQTSDTSARYNPLYCTFADSQTLIRTISKIDGSVTISRPFDTNIHTIEFNTYPTKKIIFDGVVEGTVTSVGSSTTSINLFRRNLSSSYAYVSGRIYNCQFYNGDTIVRDFIPVRDENGVGYLFDKVGHSLFANKGTGNFVVGDEKRLSKVRFIEDTSVISEYTKLKCLISSGTQYIDTGFKPNNNTEYEVSGYMNPSGVFGVARWSGESTYDTFGAHSVTANPLDYYGRYSDNKYYNGPSSMFNNNIIWKHTKNNISITNADNGTVYANENITTATFQSTYNMWIFAFNNMGSILARSVGCKMYYFKIWDNNALIKDYIPVLRNSDNKPGMYDRVTKTFFINQGTGEFTYETL